MEKIKLFLQSEKGKDLMVIIIVILVGLASFGLGRLSSVNKGSGVKIEYTGSQNLQPANTISSTNNLMSKTVFDTNPNSKNFFASNRGKRYYGVGCEAGKSIKKENRVYFSTASEAEKAGYTLSSSCD